MSDKYILKDKVPVRCDDLLEWARAFEQQRHLFFDEVGAVNVSTIFLGIDHSFNKVLRQEGPPILFETMIFGGRHDGFQKRCSTWEEAERQHAWAVEMIKQEAERAAARNRRKRL